jgi:hypothetical protein
MKWCVAVHTTTAVEQQSKAAKKNNNHVFIKEISPSESIQFNEVFVIQKSPKGPYVQLRGIC